MSEASVAAVIAGSFGVGGALAGQLLAAYLARKAHALERQDREADRRAAEEERVRDLAAEVLGAVREYLVDADPTRIGLNISKETAAGVDARLTAEWDAMRRPLATLAFRHPSRRVRDLTDTLTREVAAVVHWNRWTLANFSRDRDWIEANREGQGAHAAALQTSDRLREALHAAEGDVGGSDAGPDGEPDAQQTTGAPPPPHRPGGDT